VVDIKITICEYTIHRRQGAIDKQDVRSLTDSAEKAQTKDSMFWDWLSLR
jgi:hypothetical protein